MEYKLEHNLNENRWHILPVILLGPLMATLDSSIVNVALPDMSQKLSVGINTIQWVVTSYLIAISALILIFGRIADIIGKAKIFQYGFVIFSVGSLLCGFSKNVGFLIFSRIIQAVGASMTMSSNQGLIAAIFPSNERGKALGLSATTVAIGTMMGPPLGGIMVEIFNWETIFWINVPIGIGAFFLGRKMLPKEERKESKDSFDLKGAILFMSFVVSLFWAMLSGERLGWMNKYIIVSFIVSAASFFSFYFVETKEKSPMLDFSMFDNKIFNVSIFCAFVSFLVIFCYNIINPFYLQYIMNISPAKAGILMIVYPISAGIIASMSGYISDRLGREITTFLGLLVTTIGLVLLSFLNTSSTYIDIVTKIAILGFGNGLFQSPNNTIVMSLVPKNKLGITGSINALVRNMGMVFGIAFSVALLYNRMSHSIGYRVVNFVPGRPDVFIYAMKFVYLSAASICIIGIILTFLRIMEKRKGELLIR